MNKAFVLSVMHTGTVTLSRILSAQRALKYGKIVHVQESEADEKIVDPGPIAIPLRHPVKVWRSWVLRKRPLSLFRYSWQRLGHFHDLHGDRMTFVPVDLPGIRDDALRDLSDHVGVALTTSWEPQNVWADQETQVDTPDLSELWDLPFVRRHYPQPEEKTNGRIAA